MQKVFGASAVAQCRVECCSETLRSLSASEVDERSGWACGCEPIHGGLIDQRQLKRAMKHVPESLDVALVRQREMKGRRESKPIEPVQGRSGWPADPDRVAHVEHQRMQRTDRRLGCKRASEGADPSPLEVAALDSATKHGASSATGIGLPTGDDPVLTCRVRRKMATVRGHWSAVKQAHIEKRALPSLLKTTG